MIKRLAAWVALALALVVASPAGSQSIPGLSNQFFGAGPSTATAATTYRYFRWFSITPTTQPQLAEAQLLTAGVDQVPTMTSGTTSGVTVTADSFFAVGQEGWRAFADDGTAQFWGSNAAGSGAFLKVDFGAGNGKRPDQYTMQCPSGGTSNMMTAWILQVSNDDSNYVTIDTQTGQTWSVSQVRTYTIPSY